MSDRRTDYAMMAAAILAMILASLHSCTVSQAHASPPQTLAPGERCVSEPVRVPSLVVSAAAAARAIVAAQAEQRCSGQLKACTRRVIRATSPESAWKLTAKGFAVGLLVALAFAGGLAL